MAKDETLGIIFDTIIPFPTYRHICIRLLLKTLCQMEKLFIMCNFYICHNVFISVKISLKEVVYIFLKISATDWLYVVENVPHIDTFWRLCSRLIFENIVTKEEIAQNAQFLLLPQCFPLLFIGYPFNYREFLVFDKICSKNCRMRERAFILGMHIPCNKTVLVIAKYLLVWPWHWHLIHFSTKTIAQGVI